MWDLIVSVPDHCLSFYTPVIDKDNKKNCPFCMLKYRLQAIIYNKKDMSYPVIFKRYLNSKTVSLEYFNNQILFF